MAKPHRLAIVTGTSSGIGEAVALELLRRDWQVVGIARRRALIDDARYRHLAIDLADIAHLTEAMESALGERVADPRLARLALVNNAADPGLLGPVTKIEPGAMLRVYAVNVVAPTCLMGWLVARGQPKAALRIVSVSSGAGVSPFAGLGVYGGTKAALRMTGMVLAAELTGAARPPRDVAILCFGPGPIDTPMQALARTTPVDVFPLQETFARWATEGQLQAPDVPAAEIVTYLEADGYPVFHECYGEIHRPEAAS